MMFYFLERFQNRMEFSAVIDSIVNRRNKNSEIESKFESFEIDNILFSILVFIMESTLTEDRVCTLYEISHFVKEILSFYNKPFSLDETDNLTRYLVKDVLLNKGEKRTYGIMNYEKSSMTDITVRLIWDEIDNNDNVIYKLTEQGYNFLFRTKEIDDELGFRIEEFRLKLLIIKKNYKKAVSQSRELVQMLKNKENQLSLFEKRLRNNVKQVTSNEYTTLINEIYQMLEQEYTIMQEIQVMITTAKERLLEEESNFGTLDEKAVAAKKEVIMIERNVETALDYQRSLITKCEHTKKIYVAMLRDSIRYMHKKTYDFDKVILKPMEMGGINNTDLLDKLLLPLMKIQLNKTLNLSVLYDYQPKDEELSELTSVEEEQFEKDDENIQKEKQSWHYVKLIDEFMRYAASHSPCFELKDFILHLKDNEHTREMTYTKDTFLAFLKLYEFREINISEWKNSKDEISTEPTGEFDLSFCLFELSANNKDFYYIDYIKVERLSDVIKINSTSEAGLYLCIDNMRFEVKLLEKSVENI